MIRYGSETSSISVSIHSFRSRIRNRAAAPEPEESSRIRRKSEMKLPMKAGRFARSARNANARSRGTSIGIEAVTGPMPRFYSAWDDPNLRSLRRTARIRLDIWASGAMLEPSG